MFVVLVGRQAQCTMLAVANEVEDFRDGRIRVGQRLYLDQPFSQKAGSVKQLLIERPDGRKPLARELPALHADDIEAFEAGVLAIGEAERNDVPANPADASNHRLRSNPDKLVHRRQAADIDEVADLTMAAQCRGCREDNIVSDNAIVTDMAVVHEISASADSREAAALLRSDVHRHAFTNGASLPDF